MIGKYDRCSRWIRPISRQFEIIPKPVRIQTTPPPPSHLPLLHHVSPSAPSAMPWPSSPLLSLVLFLTLACSTHAALTVYGLNGQVQQQTLADGQPATSVTTSATTAAFTSIPAYNDVVLQAPPVPTDLTTQFSVPVSNSAQGVPNLSIQQKPGFFGFSIEFSVVNQVSEYAAAVECGEPRLIPI